MPVFEPDLSRDDMDKVMETCLCAECGSELNKIWGAEYGKNCAALVCTRDPSHNGLIPRGRDLELIEINHKLHGGLLPMETTALSKLTPGQMMERIEKAGFPQKLSNEDKRLLAAAALEWGLDPFFGELLIIHGKLYVAIGGLRRKAQDTKELDGVSTRPMTEAERKAHRLEPDDYGAYAEVWKVGGSHPYTGFRSVTKVEIEKARSDAEAHSKDPDALPLVKDPFGMAMKRAEALALKRAFHIDLPSAEDAVVDADFTVLEDKVETSKPGAPPRDKTTPPGKPNKNPITPAQKRKIEKDLETAGHGELVLKAVLKTQFNVESLDDLTVPQASKLIDMINSPEGLQVEMMPEAEG